MALPLYKHVDSIKVDLNVFTDDHKLANLDEFIIDKCNAVRDTLIREEFNNKKYVDQQYYQTVNCNEIQCLQTQCSINGIVITSPWKIYKITPTGTLMTGVGDRNIIYLGMDGFSKSFKRMSMNEIAALNGNRYTNARPKYLSIGPDVYLFNLGEHPPTFLTIVALFSSPSSVCSWTSEDIYPVPSDYKLQLLVKKDIMETWNVPYDQVNDANQILVQPNVPIQKTK